MPNEVSALLDLAGLAADRLAISPTQSLHHAIAKRVFRAVGPLSAPARIAHDGISRAVYGVIRATASGAATAAAAAVRIATNDADVRPLSATPRGRLAIGAVNSLIGDQLAAQQSDLAIRMAVRRGGSDLRLDRRTLSAAYPGASGRVAVFLHGLAETEESWLRGAKRHRGPARMPFGERLRRDLAINPVYIRYNTGLHVSDNAAQLARLLEELVAAWPVKVEELLLIGHSMGGLLARSACHTAVTSGLTWIWRLRHLVTLGTPHTGAPLEKAVHVIAWALDRVPESRPVAAILQTRSAGIRDLRYGYLLEEDWRSEDPAKLFDDRRSCVPLAGGCDHTFITASVTRAQAHPVGWMVGDLLVRSESAGGRHGSRPIAPPPRAVVHLGRLNHFDLLDHPLVYQCLRDALSSGPRSVSRRAALRT